MTLRSVSLALALLLGVPAASLWAEEKPAAKTSLWKRFAPPSNEEPAQVIGVRGLQKGAQAPDTAARDYAAIDRLEAVTVDPGDLSRFIKEGGLR